MSGAVALAAGGTGGHMFPAQALAQALKRRGRRVLLVTDARGARYAEDFPADARAQIAAASPNVGGPLAKIAAGAALARGVLTALGALRRERVAAAVGFGGYPSAPTLTAARLLGVPYGVHEQNGVLGRANRLVVRGAAFTAHAFANLDRAPEGLARRREVGHPIRDAVRPHVDAPYTPPSADGAIRLLIFGGSQGAAILSRVAPAAAARLPEDLRRRLQVVHQAREDDVAAVGAIYADAGIDHDVAPFFKDLPKRIADAHLVVARSGASTVTEISLIGRPAIFVPLAIAMDDHQTGNARALADAGAAEIFSEKEFTRDALAKRLETMLRCDDALAAMAKKARGRVKAGAAEALADLVDEVAA
ncbi:MAG: UDP-N-acetylglucosamine--N-acetylmuramyl-(pentapeptide) pyrophosphoryl-undecaprenol N-acetylglucosamine transferase [Pseudomonadota bacterium]